jgi:hypothetical protein
MKFKQERPFANPEAAVKRLLEIANGLEPDHAARLQGRGLFEVEINAAVFHCASSCLAISTPQERRDGAPHPNHRDRCARPAGVTGGSFR